MAARSHFYFSEIVFPQPIASDAGRCTRMVLELRLFVAFVLFSWKRWSEVCGKLDCGVWIAALGQWNAQGGARVSATTSMSGVD